MTRTLSHHDPECISMATVGDARSASLCIASRSEACLTLVQGRPGLAAFIWPHYGEKKCCTNRSCAPKQSGPGSENAKSFVCLWTLCQAFASEGSNTSPLGKWTFPPPCLRVVSTQRFRGYVSSSYPLFCLCKCWGKVPCD